MPTDDWTISFDTFQQARSIIKQTVANHWTRWMTDPDSVNMWKTYHSELNTNWQDPWHEFETHGISNDPYEGWPMTQNAYLIFCWMKYHEYNDYSITAILANASHESTITGGQWEMVPRVGNNAPISKHPYQNITQFDPTSTYAASAYTWYTGGSPPAYAGTAITWTATFTDYTDHVWSLQAVAGSWDAAKRFPILLETVIIDGEERVMPVGYETNQLTFNRNPVGMGDGRGYGLVQWTPWTKLPIICAHAYSSYLNDPVNNADLYEFEEANKHWQLNLTLLLMIFEYQRKLSRGNQAASDYLGQWVSTNSAIQNLHGAFFQYPYQPGANPSDSSYHYYGQSISWDNFADGTYLDWADDEIEAIETQTGTTMDSEDKEWCKRQLAMTIWMANYIHTYYTEDYGLRNISKYFLAAIRYWTSYGGYDIKDVPRPRDLPYSKLDNLHLSLPLLFNLMNRRRNKHHVCTLLF